MRICTSIIKRYVNDRVEALAFCLINSGSLAAPQPQEKLIRRVASRHLCALIAWKERAT